MLDDIPYGFCECGCGRRTAPAPQSHSKRNWIKGEPVRFISGHHRRVIHFVVGVDWVEVDHGFATSCWIWQRSHRRDGYGQMKWNERMACAHRVLYELTYGPIPAGLELDHLCRVLNCVNPDHLEAVTAAINVRRSATAKLTAEQVAEIRASDERGAVLATRYAVSQSNVSQIRRGRTWKT